MENKKIFNRHYVIAFWVTLTIAIALMVGGALTPPMFIIDGSIFKAVGEIFLWPALAFGAKALEDGKIAKISKGNTTVSIGHHGGNEPMIEENMDNENLESV